MSQIGNLRWQTVERRGGPGVPWLFLLIVPLVALFCQGLAQFAAQALDPGLPRSHVAVLREERIERAVHPGVSEPFLPSRETVNKSKAMLKAVALAETFAVAR